jgi:hypothetical protein
MDYSVIEKKRTYMELRLWRISSERVNQVSFKDISTPRSILHFPKSEAFYDALPLCQPFENSGEIPI